MRVPAWWRQCRPARRPGAPARGEEGGRTAPNASRVCPNAQSAIGANRDRRAVDASQGGIADAHRRARVRSEPPLHLTRATGRACSRIRAATTLLWNIGYIGRHGASDGTRTHGIQDHNLALYQLSYARHRKGWVCGVSGWRRQHGGRAGNGWVCGKHFSGNCAPGLRHAGRQNATTSPRAGRRAPVPSGLRGSAIASAIVATIPGGPATFARTP